MNLTDFKSTFPQVTINSLNLIPINLEKKEIEMKIIAKVNTILALDENHNNSKIILKEIDFLVYKLFDLTDEEIKLIEN